MYLFPKGLFQGVLPREKKTDEKRPKEKKEKIIIYKVIFRRLLTFLGEFFFMITEFNLCTNFIRII